jgi:hypothetical protein
MATSSSAIQKKIETLKKGLNNKFITAAQKEKIKAQVQKLESQSKASAPKKATKPAASSSLTRLQKLVKNKKYGVYKGAGVDLKKDSDRPAKAIGKRIAKSGKTYYEYRANRIDVKQPPKKYPKLEDGGYMAKGGMFEKPIPAIMDKYGNVKSEKQLEQDLKYLKEAYEDKLVTKDEYEKSYQEIQEQIKFLQSKEKGGYMAKGGKVRSQEEFNKLVAEKEKLVKNLSPKEVAEMWNKNSNSPSKMTEEEGKMSNSRMYLADLLVENELTEAEHSKYFEKGGYMAKGGKVGKYRILPMIPTGVKGMITTDYEKMESFSGTEDEAVARAKEMASSNPNFVRVEVKLPLKTKTNTVGIVDGQNKQYAKGGYMADGGRVKGRNNETGETYGVVIGSIKKSDEDIEGGTEMNVRKGYSSRISEVKLVFDKNGNLYEITDYGYGLEGNYPDTSRGSGRNYNADKKETLEVLSKKYNPAFAKKLIELAKNPKMAEGGMTEHGLRIGDKITTDMFWDNQIVVENTKTNKRAQIDLETGKRKDEMEKGGYMAKGGKLDKFYEVKYIDNDGTTSVVAKFTNETEAYTSANKLTETAYKRGKSGTYVVRKNEGKFKDGGYMAKGGDISVYNLRKGDKVKTRKGDIETIIRKTGSGSYETIESEYTHSPESLEFVSRLGRKMEDGGVTEKEVVESNADMVLSKIKEVHHHADELGNVVSRKSNIEAWVVGKIERASTDLSDITHYLEGNKDKMSMGGTVRYYAHKMDKK